MRRDPRRLFFSCLAAGLAALSGCAGPPPPPPPPQAAVSETAADYPSLLAAAQAAPGKADFARLRDAYVGSPEYAPYALTTFDFAGVDAAVHAGDWPQAQVLITQLLGRGYMRIKAHLYAAAIARRMGDTAREQYHLAFYRGLLGAITKSGDGKKPETAIKVITVEEEYDVLWSHRQTMVAQALMGFNGRVLDKLTVRGSGVATEDVFFDITVPYQTLKK